MLNGAFSESLYQDVDEEPDDYTSEYDYLSDSDLDSESDERDGLDTERTHMEISRGLKTKLPSAY